MVEGIVPVYKASVSPLGLTGRDKEASDEGKHDEQDAFHWGDDFYGFCPYDALPRKKSYAGCLKYVKEMGGRMDAHHRRVHPAVGRRLWSSDS